MTDLILAIIHHALAFRIVASLLGELLLVRPGMPTLDAQRTIRLDMGYGATAGVLLIVGALRVTMGARGWAFYEANPWFWAKMMAFAAVAILSIPPTLRFLAWGKAIKADPAFAPSDADVGKVRLWLRIEGVLLFVIIALAAAMARWGTF